MIRLCTHCKKADTQYKEYKYCTPCYLKCLRWLEEKGLEKPEPESVCAKNHGNNYSVFKIKKEKGE